MGDIPVNAVHVDGITMGVYAKSAISSPVATIFLCSTRSDTLPLKIA